MRTALAHLPELPSETLLEVAHDLVIAHVGQQQGGLRLIEDSVLGVPTTDATCGIRLDFKSDRAKSSSKSARLSRMSRNTEACSFSVCWAMISDVVVGSSVPQ